MKNIRDLIIICFLLVIGCGGTRVRQISPVEERLIKFIAADKRFSDYASITKSSKPCRSIVEGKRFALPSDYDSLPLIKSGQNIQNSPYSCLCDILKTKYKAKEFCTRLIGLNKPLTIQVSDSIDRAYKDYQFKVKKGTGQPKVYGMVVSFSNVYKNTILAEVYYRCDGSSIDMGRAITYYFELDKNNESIKNVFFGEVHKD